MTRPKHIELKDSQGAVIGDDNHIYQYFLNESYSSLRHKLITFTAFIEEKTRDFVGRQFVFDAINNYVEHESSGYFIIQGEPGIGKSSLIAQLVKSKQYVHHFIIGPQGINRAEQFLENICAQLIANFELNYPYELPPNTSRDGAFLSELLQGVSNSLKSGAKAIILIDALDEVDWRKGTRTNVLYLPTSLPEGIFIVTTRRPVESLSLQVDQSRNFYLDADSKENIQDIRTMLTQATRNRDVASQLEKENIATEDFIKKLIEKSEGNPMYLRHILPEIQQGIYGDLNLAKLPQGLMGYYELHWERMKGQDFDKWIKYRQPVICVLATMREPVSAKQVAKLTSLTMPQARWVIGEWMEFLKPFQYETEERWSVYHSSFQDFLHTKDEVGEVDLTQTNSDIADELLRRLLGSDRGA